ncbi:pyridoxamine 5'-phosphate oxidase family protein [Agarilytica rhodophyticola]|uniref:FAD-binding oxidoreductase n=1 Tax=Agarilytica rhodophyticola TaxID=1737490 RepID=UPI000B343156|nr:pyridoxamine 5'-phosphate oxidase family protein [Agarilytica rhodophyticola]
MSTIDLATSYHRGELAAQDKAGTRGAAAELAVGKRSALNFSSNHDAFLAAQSFAVLSSVNLKNGQVWVSPLFGKEGDLTAISENEIAISTHCIPENDMLNTLESGSPLSLLGIDLKRRIRHRINGLASISENDLGIGFNLQVNEYSPNCPKYINRREIIYNTKGAPPINREAKRKERATLTDDDQAFIQSMDTLWIGSYAPGVGADCNHRGGKPGFIRATSPSTIEWPEYRGNGMFFTSGNLEVYDRTGVTLVDFETGSMIQMTGRAVVNWNHDGRYEGASRSITFHIEHLIRTDHVTSHRWKRLDYSPYNPAISGKETVSSDSEFPVVATLAKIVEESENVKTFRFVVPRRLAFLPGQYATFEFKHIPNGSASEVRTWTLSETPNSISGDNTLDITVKRIPKGLVTNWLHDHAELGLEVQLNGIQGEMTAVRMDAATKQPVVHNNLLLLSAGIGITPNLAMVRGVGAFSLQDQTTITMIHVERNTKDLINQQELLRRARSYPHFNYTNIITSQQGRLNKEQLQKLVPHAEHQHAYICGPTLFMNDMTQMLVSIGVPAANVYTESFEF